MKVTFVLICAALFYVHVAQGKPTDTNDSSQSKPQADQAQAQQSQQAAPAAEKPETCTASVNGQQQTLNTGDRYCLDQTTHRVCNYGVWIDGVCPDNSVCLKSPSSWQVLCRIIRRNPPQAPHPQDDNAPAPQNNNAQAPQNAPAPQNDNSNSQSPESSPSNNPLPPPPPPKQGEPQPQETSTTTTATTTTATTTAATTTTATTTQQPPSNPGPAPSNPAPPPPPPSNPGPAPSNPAPPPPPPNNSVPPAPQKPETCKATINGQDQTLQPGDRYCLDDNTNRVCNWGEFVDFQCPSGSKCLKSPDKWQVLCRVDNRKSSATSQNGKSNNQ